MARRLDVLCLGCQVIDLLATGADRSIFDRDLTNAGEISMLLGGDALNQAVTLSLLGAKTGLMSVVGKDQLGQALLNQLGNYPIELHMQAIEAKTGISIVLCRPDGERHFFVQLGHNEYFCYDHIDEQAVRDADILSIGSLMELKSFDGAGMLKLLDLAASAGVMTAADIKITHPGYNSPAALESMRRFDYLLPSEADVKTLTGEGEEPVRMVEALHDMGVKNVILKLGGRGCYISADGVEKEIPAKRVRCVDATGAGDTFMGAFLYAKSKGWDIETCARFANAAGSINVEHYGASGMIRSEAQVLERMRQE